jgi:hypothetical protein
MVAKSIDEWPDHLRDARDDMDCRPTSGSAPGIKALMARRDASVADGHAERPATRPKLTVVLDFGCTDPAPPVWNATDFDPPFPRRDLGRR